MPTGYTHQIGAGCTFEEFAWSCARAFGALIMMRDEPADAPVPEEFRPSRFYREMIEEARAGLDRLEAMTDAEAAREAAEERRKIAAGNAEREAEAATLAEKYHAMLARARAWVPPSPDHEGLKDFMIEQITTSIRHDCTPWRQELPDADGRRWRLAQAAGFKADLARARKHWREEQERTAGRNRWVRQLRESIPQPVKADEATGPTGGPPP